MKYRKNFVILLLILQSFFVFAEIDLTNNLTFPSNFKFGVSTSAYQIEGAWNEDGKGENIWDHFTHNYPNRISDKTTGDKACNSYHLFKEDIKLLKYLNIDFYRFSLSWSRILPTGFSNNINSKGINYYSKLIDSLIKNNIEPIVTLYHWDLPQSLQDLGGWTNPILMDYFVQYVKVVFENFASKVKTWITFNEPKLICNYGYGDTKMAPGINSSGIGNYICGKTILMAHAKVYHLYSQLYRKFYNGKIGISLHSEWFEPATKNPEDFEAAKRKLLFDFGWFGNPIFHPKGNYPKEMIDRIHNRSKLEGFVNSRLPELTEYEKNFIKGTYDFLGLNFYTASVVKDGFYDNGSKFPCYYKDVGVTTWKKPEWPSSAAKRLKVVPWSIHSILKWIKNNYGNVNIIITENGYADQGEVKDIKRIAYIQNHLYYVLKAIHEDNINVQGYSVWSLVDNFEWFSGYSEHYGLFGINFKDPNLGRYKKNSAVYYKSIIETRDLVLINIIFTSDAVFVTLNKKLLFLGFFILLYKLFKF